MRIFLVWEDGKSKVVEAQAVPQIGSKICDDLYMPTVITVLMWPSDNYLRGTGVEGTKIEAIVTLSRF